MILGNLDVGSLTDFTVPGKSRLRLVSQAALGPNQGKGPSGLSVSLGALGIFHGAAAGSLSVAQAEQAFQVQFLATGVEDVTGLNFDNLKKKYSAGTELKGKASAVLNNDQFHICS